MDEQEIVRIPIIPCKGVWGVSSFPFTWGAGRCDAVVAGSGGADPCNADFVLLGNPVVTLSPSKTFSPA
jgi:hypothetical protein